jgi:hypothetical protein
MLALTGPGLAPSANRRNDSNCYKAGVNDANSVRAFGYRDGEERTVTQVTVSP